MQVHMLGTILCPVDFSEVSAHALRYARMLADCGQAEVVAAHATWFEAPPYFTESRIAELQTEFRESMSEAQRSLRAFVKATLGIGAATVETRVTEALPADGIRQMAADVQAGLIVMGTHGRSGLNRWMLGSVAERVLRESAVPVLTVRGAAPGPVRHILCPVHDTEESRRALTFAAGLGVCLGATLTALYVHEPHAAKAAPSLCSWLPAEEWARCDIRELERRGDAAEEIVRLASAEAIDLLVLGAPRRRFFEGMVLGTTTLRAVRHAGCPVLTVG